MNRDVAHESNESLSSAFSIKMRVELQTAEKRAPLCGEAASNGPMDAQTLVFKGQLGPSETAGGVAVSGADRSAILAALDRLGWDSGRVFFAWAPLCADQDPAARAARLVGIVEAIDPELVVALDADATGEVATALGIAQPGFGRIHEPRGRTFIGVDGLEASLTDEVRKRRVWSQLKAARRRPVY